jgi:methylenetetrahydrofolate reductase (NADPH)
MRVSIEVFPPRTMDAEGRLAATIARLAPLEPAFVSVTYGAGGTSRDDTLEAARRILRRTGLPVAGHLTCAGQTREETNAVIHAYAEAGIRHIVALRGDVPGGGPYVPTPGGYRDTPELVAAIRSAGPFEVSVSAYPEGHPESRSRAADLELLARKVDAGATRAITQFCLEPEPILRLRDDIDAAGIDVPLVPGLLPVTDLAAAVRIASRCGATVPHRIARRLHGLEDDPDTRGLLGAVAAAELTETLLAEGFDDLHVYTLNRPEIAALVLTLAGHPARQAVAA